VGDERRAGEMGDDPSRFSDAYHPECPGDDRQDSKPADTHEHDEETRAVGAPPYVEAQVHKERRDSGRSNCDEEKGSASPSLGAAAASAPIEKEEKNSDQDDRVAEKKDHEPDWEREENLYGIAHPISCLDDARCHTIGGGGRRATCKSNSGPASAAASRRP